MAIPEHLAAVPSPASVLALVSALLTAACSAPAENRQATAPPPRRPNLVFVLVDDMRWDDLGAAGHPFLETPHMNRLAAEGARFTNAFATTPLCSPSRASFLTGQYPHTNGITDNTARESHNLPVFPLDLQQAGYRTGFFGKWHMGNDDSPRPGFDHWVAMPGQGEAIDPSLNVDGQRVQAKGYTTDLLTDYVERFIDRPGDAPFLVYLAHKAIHPNVIQNDDGSLTPLAGQPGGFVAAERHRGRYVGRPMPRRANAFVPPADKPALRQSIAGLPPLGKATATTDEEIRGRLEMLLAVDDSLGRIVATLARKGILDDTMVVFTSDHGYFYGEHGLNEERRLAYEETIRIPLIVRFPRLVKAGHDPGGNGAQHRPGANAAGGGRAAARRPDAGSLARPGAHAAGPGLADVVPGRVLQRHRVPAHPHDGVFGGPHRPAQYIQFRDLRGMDELYDLEADPYELTNIIGKPEARELLPQMQSELQRLLDATR